MKDSEGADIPGTGPLSPSERAWASGTPIDPFVVAHEHRNWCLERVGTTKESLRRMLGLPSRWTLLVVGGSIHTRASVDREHKHRQAAGALGIAIEEVRRMFSDLPMNRDPQ